MTIDFSCSCGKTLKAPDGSGGKRARCPKCGAIVTVPVGVPVPAGENEYELREPEPVYAHPVEQPATCTAARVPAAASAGGAASYPSRLLTRGRSLRSFAYLLLILAFVPLVVYTFQSHEKAEDQLVHTVAAHPELPDLKDRIVSAAESARDEADAEEKIFAELPGHRMEGALLARDTMGHWVVALVAAGAYFGFLLAAFPRAPRYTKGLLFAGFFTATAGILFLLAVQWLAFNMPFTVRGGGKLTLILLIVKLIGYSYAMAESDFGFFLSFLGFTCGVGLCEEVTKAIPMLLRIKPAPGEDDATWNTMLLWGLASGIGFGIAEGIMYSGRYYNGIEGTSMYLVRFMSCVVLHAVWAGSVGITMHRRQGWLFNAENNWTYCGWVAVLVMIPATLHGLYDTMLKQGHEVWALGVAVGSFGWLAWQIETRYRKEPEAVLPVAA